jgi:hypothetical protein
MDSTQLRPIAIVLNVLLIGAALIEFSRVGFPKGDTALVVLLIFLAPAASLAVLLRKG